MPPCHGGGRGFKSRLGRHATACSSSAPRHRVRRPGRHHPSARRAPSPRPARRRRSTLCFLDVATHARRRARRRPDGRRPAAAVDRLPRADRHPGRRRRPHPTRRGPPPRPDPLLTTCSSTGSRPSRPRPVPCWSGPARAGPRPPAELAAAAGLLGARLGAPSRSRRWATTAAVFADAAGAVPGRHLPAGRGAVRHDVARRRRGRGAVAPPLGVHPALVELVWRRYDEAGPAHPVDFARFGPYSRCGCRCLPARPGSSVGTSVRLKSGRSTVRSCPWPPRHPGGAGSTGPSAFVRFVRRLWTGKASQVRCKRPSYSRHDSKKIRPVFVRRLWTNKPFAGAVKRPSSQVRP